MHEPASQVYIKNRLGRPGSSNKENWKRKMKIMEKGKGRFKIDLQDGKWGQSTQCFCRFIKSLAQSSWEGFNDPAID